MRKFQSLLFVLKWSYICYNIICMTVPLNYAGDDFLRVIGKNYCVNFRYENFSSIRIPQIKYG